MIWVIAIVVVWVAVMALALVLCVLPGDRTKRPKKRSVSSIPRFEPAEE